MLFGRISRLNFNGEIKKEEATQMSVLLDGITVGLHKEYLSISSVILNFIEMYTGRKVDLKVNDMPLFNDHIIIDKVNILSA